jgi:DNA polymerase epsilon subunit 2
VRTLRHRLFSAGHRKAQTAQFSLQKIEYLKGCTTKMKDIVVLGMLNQMKEGEWWIEDPYGAIIIDMKARFRNQLEISHPFVNPCG